MTLFPNHGLKALPYAKRVSISAPNLGADFDGVVLELPGKPKTLYVDGKGAAAVNLRERCVVCTFVVYLSAILTENTPHTASWLYWT